MNINSFFFNKKIIKDLENWINKDYKKQFLFIHGNDSCGKNSLAECILNKYLIQDFPIDEEYFNSGEINGCNNNLNQLGYKLIQYNNLKHGTSNIY